MRIGAHIRRFRCGDMEAAALAAGSMPFRPAMLARRQAVS
jgi:hypothetical protein